MSNKILTFSTEKSNCIEDSDSFIILDEKDVSILPNIDYMNVSDTEDDSEDFMEYHE